MEKVQYSCIHSLSSSETKTCAAAHCWTLGSRRYLQILIFDLSLDTEMEPHWAVLYRRAPVALRRAPAHRPLRRHTMHNPRPLWWAQAQASHYRPTNSPPRWTQAGSAASSRRWVAVNQPTGDRKCKAQMTCLNSSSI